MQKTLPGLLVMAFAAVAVSVAVHAVWPDGTSEAASPAAAKESVFDRTMRTGVLRCGYVIYPPLVVKDPNTGKLSGIFVDLTEKIAEMTLWKVEWSAETTFATMQEDMKAGKYDVYCGGSWAVFPPARTWANSIAAFYSPVMIYARADDSRFKDNFDIAQLNDPAFKFAEADGELSQIAQQQDFPKASTLQLPQYTQISDLALSVASRKADVALIEKSAANDYMRHNPGALKDIGHGKPVRIFGDTWQFAHSETALRHVFDNAINDMLQSGFVEKILRKYEMTPDTYYRAAPLYLIPPAKP